MTECALWGWAGIRNETLCGRQGVKDKCRKILEPRSREEAALVVRIRTASHRLLETKTKQQLPEWYLPTKRTESSCLLIFLFLFLMLLIEIKKDSIYHVHTPDTKLENNNEKRDNFLF